MNQVITMPKRDLYHECVKNALRKDAWSITNDPLVLKIGKKDLFVDLGAEKLIAAEKGNHKIAVEIKSFLGQSDVNDLENALGQYILYHDVLAIREPERNLYLAIRDLVFSEIFEEPIGQVLLANQRIKLLVFDPIQEVIIQWLP